MLNIEALIPGDWKILLGDYLGSGDWQQLQANLQKAISEDANAICPPPPLFFRALALTPVDAVSVVILGQDPYHSPGLAQGLAFSIPESIVPGSRSFPSSLRNISKALELEGFGPLAHGDLHEWAGQGVLLLNTALSVKQGEAGSHFHLGWQHCINALIRQLSIAKPDLVWLLWGAHAQSKIPLIEHEGLSSGGSTQLILQASHPSGLGVYKTVQPFLIQQRIGEPPSASCGHFTKANDWLIAHGKDPIHWIGSQQQTRQSGLFADDGQQ
jgi:uracil-DNA glycosylase